MHAMPYSLACMHVHLCWQLSRAVDAAEELELHLRVKRAAVAEAGDEEVDEKTVAQLNEHQERRRHLQERPG